jgi:UDP-N-acetylmuramyl pentapeptide synthase
MLVRGKRNQQRNLARRVDCFKQKHHRRGTEATEGMSFVDDAVNAGPKHFNIEIDQKTEANASEF